MGERHEGKTRFSAVLAADDARLSRRPRRGGIATAIVAVLLLAGAAVVIAVASNGGGSPAPSDDRSAGRTSPQHLLTGMRSLPAVRPGIIGVLQVLRPGSAWISRERAIADYDRIPSVPTTEGRVVKTALARIAYLDRGQERQDTVWIVSVWYHPANVGVAHQRQWCVAHQLLQATTGAPFYGTGGCVPAGRHPVEVTSG